MNEESSRFSNDFDLNREELINHWSDGVGNDSEVDTIIIRSWPSTSKVEHVEFKSNFFGFLEDTMSRSDSRNEGIGTHASRSNMERDSANVQVEILSELKQAVGSIKRSSELGRESANRFGVVCDDSKQKTSVSEVLADLDKFVGVVESHEIYIAGFGVLDVGFHLARVGIDDSVGSNSTSKDLLNFGFGSAIEVGSKRGQKLDDGSVRVALDRIEGLDSWQVRYPFFMFANDCSKIYDVEGFVFDDSFVDLRLEDSLD